ncbi:MAG: aminodeoxychorismate synthase component I [Planctomycetota bacterium]
MPTPVKVEEVEQGCRPFPWLRSVADQPYPALLESSRHGYGLGRYSILCAGPDKVVSCTSEGVRVEREGDTGDFHRGDPFRILAAEFDPHRLDLPSDFPMPFAGGAVGFFSYDLRHYVEDLPLMCQYDLDVPGFVLCFYDRGLVFDHREETTYYVGPRGSRAPTPERVEDAAGENTEILRAETSLRSNFEHEEYCETVRRAKDYIAAGDIFQVNLSQRFGGAAPLDGLAIYGRLREINPAPFGGYLAYPDCEIISSSPERFLELSDDLVVTRPIKGTRPRVEGYPAFNRAMKTDLLESAKDHAELAMIVDLERNDLGRVCSYNSIRVEEHAALESYPTVFHLVSTVKGRLHRPHHDEFDLIRATFPGGSITGAPKIRAMEIIEELEPHARAAYTGSMGYISYHGRMDLNIIIRTILRTQGRVYMQVGGGIVADSDPEEEYRETLDKGLALFRCVGDSSEFMEYADEER